MEKRSFEKSTWFLAAMITALVLVLLGAVYQVFAAPPGSPPDRPAAALYAVTWNSTAITETTTATAVTTQNYAYQDVACSVDVASAQSLTITLQASLDNTNWFQTHDFAAITADTTVTTGIFSRTLSYGRYERMVITLLNANLVTPTCKSVFFNNWMPGDDVQMMDR